jgi:hypothetical protein
MCSQARVRSKCKRPTDRASDLYAFRIVTSMDLNAGMKSGCRISRLNKNDKRAVAMA